MNKHDRRLITVYALVAVSAGLALTVTAFLPVSSEVRLGMGCALIIVGWILSKVGQ